MFASQSLPDSFSNNRILAVDDTIDNLTLLQVILEGEGYEVSLATDGISALDEVEKALPGLILLDVMMPGMDGYEVAQRIRSNKRLPYIPILLLTAHDRSNVVRGLDAGADDFVRKPFDTNELLARVRSLLRLKHSLDRQEEMSRQREDFVSRLTHDLRTPLVANDRMLHLFLQEAFCPISADMKEAIRVMLQSNQNLLQMINTLLEVYRHDAGKKEITVAPSNLQEISQSVVQELQPLAESKGICLSLECDADLGQNDGTDATVMGDGLELRRVVWNLVNNAIKFTDSGSVVVRLLPRPASQQVAQSWWTIEVKDTGSGIAPEEQPMIFERFRKGNHKRADSGLGLYLSRRIVEAHQGTIAVQSKPGQGSLFTVSLPIQPIAS